MAGWRGMYQEVIAWVNGHLSRWQIWSGQTLERAKGIEPSYAAWEATVLPLNYAR
jgi:hypothetical protein